MTAQNDLQPSFFPLGGRLGWRTADLSLVSDGAAGLHLAALPGGPLAMDNPDGSLGALTLPTGFALDGQGAVYILELRSPWQVLRYSQQIQAFEPLAGVGGSGDEARRFHRPRSLAIAGRNLYIADSGNRRVQVFQLDNLALRHLWRRPFGRPLDVAAWEVWAFILDADGNRIYRVHSEGERLELVAEAPFPARWQRIAADRDGRIYLLNRLDPQQPVLDVFTPELPRAGKCEPGRGLWERFTDAGQVRDRFDPPAIRLHFDQRPGSPLGVGIFRLPAGGCVFSAELAVPDQLAPGACPPAPSAPALIQVKAPQAAADSASPAWFDRNGSPVEFRADEFVEARQYQSSGVWTSEPLDSRIYRCQWHRIELLRSALPPGTRLAVSTYTSHEQTLPIQPMWVVSYQAAGSESWGKSASEPPALSGEPASTDFLVQSRPGQYLWLKVELFGDGFSSPLIAGMRVHYPRQSYLANLPAVFSEDESRWFLERFLAIIQTEWDTLEASIARFAALFDPAAVPAQGGFLENLARWLALPLEGEWDSEQKRRLLVAVPEIYPHRGTPQGLRRFLQVYLQNMGGAPSGSAGYPLLVEGFRERQLFTRPTSQPPAPLWSLDQVDRLQLGAHANAGKSRLVSTGDPQLDLFYEYAHRFRVYIPAAWVRSADDERMLRRALEAEKPAQTDFDLCLVEPRLRVGLQSTVGLDTILGGIPRLRLACPQEREASAPSLAPCGILGYDSVLGGHPERAASLGICGSLQPAGFSTSSRLS